MTKRGIITRAIIELTCEGEAHRVEISKGGKLRLLDHSDAAMKTLDAFVAFEADAPETGCLGFARAFRKDPYFTILSLAPSPDEATHGECIDCGWKGTTATWINYDDPDDESDELTIDLITTFQDLRAGAIVPEGWCPKCGGLVYLCFEPWEPGK